MMTREEIFGKLTEIFRENFDDDNIELTDATSASDIEGWDSLEQVNLIMMIQEEMGVRFNIEEVNAMKNVGEMADFILNKM